MKKKKTDAKCKHKTSAIMRLSRTHTNDADFAFTLPPFAASILFCLICFFYFLKFPAVHPFQFEHC